MHLQVLLLPVALFGCTINVGTQALAQYIARLTHAVTIT